MAENAYYTLLTSLPHIDSLFNSKITPISRIQLDRRLSMLDAADRETLVKVEQLIHWSHLGDDVDEQSLINLAQRLIQELGSPGQNSPEQRNSPDLKELVNWRLDMRTVVSALRRKARGVQAPTTSRWSFGSRYAYIRRNWSNPGLGLQHTFPWIPTVIDCLSREDYLTLEKTLLEAVWNKLNELSLKHSSDFEAVVIYLLRWNLVARWTANSGEEAITRFRDLTEMALGDFADQLPG